VLGHRLIAAVPDHLLPRGVLLAIHFSVNGWQATLERMRAAGLDPAVAERRWAHWGRC
jgi:hypothetical protein